MKTKQIIFILIAAIIIVSIMIAYKTTDRVIEDKKQKELAENKGTEGSDEQELPTLKPGSEGISEGEAGEGGGAGGGASGGSGEGTGSSELPDENRTLPSDINNKPCSFYFLEYGVCAGTCPRGTCQLIGKSCYCILS